MQKYFVGFSPSNKLVARDLMTAPLTFICLKTVSSYLSFSNSRVLSSVRFCSNFRISSDELIFLCQIFFFKLQYS